MNVVIDYEYTDGGEAFCPFAKGPCRMECMLMRPTGFGEPRCSMRVIADELVLIDKGRKDVR